MPCVAVDALLLARCDVLVGKFTSGLFRAAYALAAARKGGLLPPFVSLDAPWCAGYSIPGLHACMHASHRIACIASHACIAYMHGNHCVHRCADYGIPRGYNDNFPRRPSDLLGYEQISPEDPGQRGGIRHNENNAFLC